MAWQIGWTETALADVEATAAFVARDSEHYAMAVVREAFRASASLSDFANRGRTVPEFNDETIRELIVHDYRLVYHVARDLVRLWRREKRGTDQP